MTTAKLYYEAHVTIDPPSPELESSVRLIAGLHRFKLANLFMRKTGAEHTDDAFLTGHGTELDDITYRTRTLCLGLKRLGATVRRYKIEDTVLDSRSDGDPLGVLE